MSGNDVALPGDELLRVSDVRREFKMGRNQAYEVVHAIPHVEGPLRAYRKDVKAYVDALIVHPSRDAG